MLEARQAHSQFNNFEGQTNRAALMDAAVGVQKRMPEIGREIGQLRQSLAAAHDDVSKLLACLEPVLRPMGPASVGDGLAAAIGGDATATMLGQELHAIRQQVDSIAAQVRGAAARLEL